jgi:hypothetical protein
MRRFAFRPRSRGQRQEGAALVEGVMVAGMLVCLLGCMFVVHRFCALQLEKLDEARAEAWRKSMNGCGSEEPSLPEMTLEIKDGNGPPLPLSFVPFFLQEERSFQVTGGPFSPSGKRAMKFVCNPYPPKTKPLTDMVNWLGDLFL